MAQADWGTLTGSLTDEQVLRGPTAGTAPPSGGGNHTYGMRSVSSAVGAVAMYCLQANFSPTPAMKGGRISGALKRGLVGSANGFAPFLYFCGQGNAIGDNAYLLGLSDETSAHVELRKGPISLGLPAAAEVNPAVAPNILMRSTETVDPDTWQHLRLDVIVQGTGDVILQVFRSNLAVRSVTNPVWETIAGMTGNFAGFKGFVDDALGVNTGSSPLTSGMIGFGARFDQPNRTAYFDHIAVERQV